MYFAKISAGALLLLSVGACSKKEAVLEQRETWLTTGGWRMTSYTFSARAASGGAAVQLEFISGYECEADDLYRFAPNSQLQWDKNGTFCSAPQPALTEWASWQLLDRDTKLVIDHQGRVQFPYTRAVAGPLDVEELTATTMVLKSPEMKFPGDSLMMYTYRFVKE